DNLLNYSDRDTNNVVDFNPMFCVKLSKMLQLCYSSGVSLFSSKFIGKEKFGGYFSFNHFAKVFFKIKKLTFNLGMQHYSNNGIFYPNDGINFYFLSVGWKY
ncbi:MAG: acyloxyacyl hydrolase, partial [Desulfurobacteriaceae bacterium]